MTDPDPFVFGDAEPADAYDPTAPIDPDQVGHRLHDLREALDELIGRGELDEYHELPDEHRDWAHALGDIIVDRLLEHDPDDGADLAEYVHDVQRFLRSGALPAWDELAVDEQAIAVALMTLIVDWLRAEGTLT